MIISDEVEKFDPSIKILSYDFDASGKRIEKFGTPEFAGENNLAQDYNNTRAMEWNRLIKDLYDGKISPVGLYASHQSMMPEELAMRMKKSPKAVKTDFTPEGFKKLKISDLLRYATIFGICVGDFFIFINTKKTIAPETKLFQDRLIQNIKLDI